MWPMSGGEWERRTPRGVTGEPHGTETAPPGTEGSQCLLLGIGPPLPPQNKGLRASPAPWHCSLCSAPQPSVAMGGPRGSAPHGPEGAPRAVVWIRCNPATPLLPFPNPPVPPPPPHLPQPRPGISCSIPSSRPHRCGFITFLHRSSPFPVSLRPAQRRNSITPLSHALNPPSVPNGGVGAVCGSGCDLPSPPPQGSTPRSPPTPCRAPPTPPCTHRLCPYRSPRRTPTLLLRTPR